MRMRAGRDADVLTAKCPTGYDYDRGVKAVWQGRVSQAAAKYGEQAPMAATCCNACRTCVQTNAIAAALAVALAAGAGVSRIARRVVRSA